MKILMKYCFLLVSISLFSSFSVEAQHFDSYHSEHNFKLLREGYKAFNAGNHILTDSLCSVIINNGESRIEKLMPYELNPYYLKGQNNLMLRRYTKAIIDFNHLAVDTTTNLGVLASLSECYKMNREFNKALELCNRLIILQPTNPYFISHRGDCYLYSDNKTLACADYKRAQSLGIDDITKTKQLKNCR